ncbi:MAG: extracellular solute-binding protein [bacterium]|nr:extracellular solute-binding protein [bacterium]
MDKHTTAKNVALPQGMSRRDFIKTTGGLAVAAGTGVGLLGQAPAFAQARELHILEWSSFIKPADVETDRQAAEFGKQEGIKVRVEHINANDLNARATAAVESGSGPDIIRLLNNQPHLYAKGLIDHGGLIQELGGEQIWPALRDGVNVDGVYRGVPYFSGGGAYVYRRDLFDEAGVAAPQTWDDMMEVGTKVKQLGYPIGQSLGHSFGDPPGFAYTFLWSFGGSLVDENSKVAINSQATRNAIKFLKEFWVKGCDESGLAWDDSSNNRAFLGETLSCTLNGASIYFVAKRNWVKKKNPFVWRLHHFLSPEGPAGRFHTFGGQSSCIMTHSKVQSAAKNYIRFIGKDENFEKFFVINNGYVKGVLPKWQKHEMWSYDPALTPYRDLATYGRHIGYPGPYDRRASEVFAKYIVVDLFARAVRGESADSVIKWAESELNNIYS